MLSKILDSIDGEDYRALMETLYLSSDPKTKANILEGKSTLLSECIPEEDVDW